MKRSNGAGFEMDIQSSSFRYGLYLDPAPDDEVVPCLKEAEKKAKSLSMDKGGVLVAVWQDGDRVVRLFAGGDEFVPVKL